MALFKTFKGLSDNLMTGKPNAVEGYAYFTTDDGKFYIDISTANTAVIGTNRIPLSADFADRIPYAVNNQNSTIYNKTITTTDPFTFKEGALILIKFINEAPGGITQENNAITFSINGNGPNKVYFRSKRIPNEYISQGKIYLFRLNKYHNSVTNEDELIYDLIGDIIPDLGMNETVITDENGQITSAPLSERFEIVSSLEDIEEEDNNKIYLVPTGQSSGGGSGSGSGSGVTYTLTKSGNTITLTPSSGTSSSVTDVGLSQSETQNLIDSTITTALTTQYPQL